MILSREVIKTVFGSFDTVDLRRNRVSVKSVGVQVNI